MKTIESAMATKLLLISPSSNVILIWLKDTPSGRSMFFCASLIALRASRSSPDFSFMLM